MKETNSAQTMNVQKIAADFDQLAIEGFGPNFVSWSDVTSEDLQWAMSLCSTEEEVTNELLTLFFVPG